jgi:hypothetical protein
MIIKNDFPRGQRACLFPCTRAWASPGRRVCFPGCAKGARPARCLKRTKKGICFFLTRLDWAWGCWVLSPAHHYRVSPHVPSFPSQCLRSVSTTWAHTPTLAPEGRSGVARRSAPPQHPTNSFPSPRTASTPYEQPPMAAATHRLATMLQWLPHHRSWAGSAMVGARRTPWPGTRWTPPLPPSLALGHFPPAGAPRCGVATRPATCAARWLRAQAPTCCLRHHLSAKAPLSAFARAPR